MHTKAQTHTYITSQHTADPYLHTTKKQNNVNMQQGKTKGVCQLHYKAQLYPLHAHTLVSTNTHTTYHTPHTHTHTHTHKIIIQIKKVLFIFENYV